MKGKEKVKCRGDGRMGMGDVGVNGREKE